jgi:amino acid transporter
MMGVTTTYNTGLRYGGPASMTLGWFVVTLLNGCVALSMAEICSAYPTSGGLYYWSAKLAGKEWAPLASWVTGWCVLLGTFRSLLLTFCHFGVCAHRWLRNTINCTPPNRLSILCQV